MKISETFEMNVEDFWLLFSKLSSFIFFFIIVVDCFTRMFRTSLLLTLLASASAFQGLPNFSPSLVASRSKGVRNGLLKGIDPLLTPELLNVLRSAGHGKLLVHILYTPQIQMDNCGYYYENKHR
jgi:hypothetical protein